MPSTRSRSAATDRRLDGPRLSLVPLAGADQEALRVTRADPAVGARRVRDPAADNIAAIACYRKVGFRTVGVMRRYEPGADGVWPDGLLPADLVRPAGTAA